MDRLRVGIGIFILTLAFGSCATGIRTSTLPILPARADDVTQSETSESVIKQEIPQTSFAAPPRMLEPEGQGSDPESPPLARLAVPVPRPQISVSTRTPPPPRVAGAPFEESSPALEPELEPEQQPSENRQSSPTTTTPSAPSTAPVTAQPFAAAPARESSQSLPAEPAPESSQSLPAAPAPAAPTASTEPEPNRLTEQTRREPPPADSTSVAGEIAPNTSAASSSRPERNAVETAPLQTAPSPATRPATSATAQPQPAFSGPSDEVTVELPGEGWIYVGAEPGNGPVRLRRKRTRGGNSIFSFEMTEAGEYTLWFQRQDSRTGTFENETVSVRATESSPEGRSALRPEPLDEEASPPVDSDVRPFRVDYSLPLEVIAEGDLRRGVGLLLEMSDEHDPRLEHLDDQQVATLMSRADELPADLQLELLEGVADSATGEASAARSALLEVSIAREDADAALAASNGLILAGEAQPEQLLDAANLVARTGNHEEAVGLALTALGEDVSPQLLASHLDDEALFLHARRLETLGPGRDLRKALAFYETIVNDFPLSTRWEESRARVSHLKRHYFDVR